MRLGIIGTGRIADRFMRTALIESEIANVSQNERIEEVCVYNPHIYSAKRFAGEHNIYTYTDDLKKFYDKVDAVYIASPHETHYEYAKSMLLAGKDVLCEKPIALNKAEAEDLYKLAEKKSLVLMEAVKTAYCPGFKALIQMAQSGKIGRIVDVEASFTRLTPFYSREYMAPVYNGSMLEFGSYVLLPIIKLFGTNYKNIRFNSIRSVNGVDAYTKVFLHYDNGMATGKMGIGVKSEGQLLISGTNGYILAESPWWLTKKFEVRYEDAFKREVYTYPYESSGLQYEMKEFLRAIAVKDMESAGKVSVTLALMPEESIAMVEIMEKFLKWNIPNLKTLQKKLVEKYEAEKNKDTSQKLKIWAHRGCSYAYPENTIMAFKAAAELPGITGIELDVQLTKDDEIVVFHDENVSRITDGEGNVADHTLDELKRLKLCAGTKKTADEKLLQIPTLSEVLEFLKTYCENKGLLINIELKTSVVRYEGIEEKVIKMVKDYGLSDYIVYSSFLRESVHMVKQLDKNAKTAILAYWLEECADGVRRTGADALHPAIGGLGFELPVDMEGKPVRAWNSQEPFFGEDKPFAESRLDKYEMFKATDIITNVPERYLT